MQVVGEAKVKAGKPTFSQTKLEGAKKKGIKLLTEQALLDIVDQNAGKD